MGKISISATRGFKGVWMPDQVYGNNNLNDKEKYLLTEIANLQKLGECRASNKHFADFLGVSQRYVTKLISRLQEKGYIRSKIYRDPQTKQVLKRVLELVDVDTYGTIVREGVEQSFGRGMEQNDGRGIEQSFHKKNTEEEYITKEYKKENSSIVPHSDEYASRGEPVDEDGIPFDLGDFSPETEKIYRYAIKYFLHRYENISLHPHKSYAPSYWRKHIDEADSAIRNFGIVDLDYDVFRTVIDYFFDEKPHKGTMEFAQLFNYNMFYGALTKCFNGGYNDFVEAGMCGDMDYESTIHQFGFEEEELPFC